MKSSRPAILAAVVLFPAILAAAPAVSVSENENSYTLANGILTAKV